MNEDSINLNNPLPESEGVISVGTSVILSIITCGIYGLVWQYKQMKVLNSWLNRKEYSFGKWLLLSIITCGIYGVYNEYKMARGIIEVQQQNKLLVNNVATICLIMTLIGLGIVSMAIQQSEINKFYIKQTYDN
jgi:hypothetical protein|tara:strand:+ start:1211 stop:1612 length:402 start_codon:yes stop_codon:yes gene_type:complete